MRNRDRAWRRWVEEKTVIRRLRKIRPRYYHIDANGFRKYNSDIIHFIGTDIQFLYKTLTTTKFDSRNKSKYSTRSNKSTWGRNKSKTKEYQKLLFSKILKEYGIK
jgi:hypothetical protein